MGNALINRDHKAAYQYLEETYEYKRPMDRIDLSKKAEITIISSLLTDIPGPFHAWSRECAPSEHMLPRLEAVFHNDRKDPYQKLRWTIPDRQGCAKEFERSRNLDRSFRNIYIIPSFPTREQHAHSVQNARSRFTKLNQSYSC